MDVNVTGGELSEEEIAAYKEFAKEKYETADQTVSCIDIEIDGDFVNIHTRTKPIKFQRIRRITGYLVGTLDRFNDGKRAEEHDRVKHDAPNYYDPREYSGLLD